MKWTLFKGAATGSISSMGGIDSSSVDKLSRGVPGPSGVGIKSSRGVKASFSSLGGGDRVTGGTVGYGWVCALFTPTDCSVGLIGCDTAGSGAGAWTCVWGDAACGDACNGGDCG